MRNTVAAQTTRTETPRTATFAGKIVLATMLRLLLYAILLAPIAIFFLHAFSVRWFYPEVIPTNWTFDTVMRQLGNPRTGASLWASLEIAVLVSGLSLLVGYPAGRVLGLYTFRGKTIIYVLLFLPTVVPPIATGIGLNILFLQLGLAGTTLGVALVHLIPVLPYSVFAIASVFARYDINFEYQAAVLGAGWWRILRSVTLPLVFPGLAVAAFFAFLISWSQYLLTLLIGGGRVVTLPILLFATVSGGNPSTISVQSLLFVLVPIIGVILLSRYLSATSRLTRI